MQTQTSPEPLPAPMPPVLPLRKPKTTVRLEEKRHDPKVRRKAKMFLVNLLERLHDQRRFASLPSRKPCKLKAIGNAARQEERHRLITLKREMALAALENNSQEKPEFID